MKFILLLILLTSTALAQTPGGREIQFNSIWGADYNANFVLNPSAKKNTSSTATSSAAIARVTTAGYKIDNVASFSCDASAQNGYCEFTLDTIRNPADEGNCEFKGVVKGDGTLYAAQILDGSSNVLATSQVLGNQTLWTPFSLNYVCGSSRKVRITQTVAGTAPVIYLGKLYYGQATNVGSNTPPNTFTARVSSAGVVSDETGGDFINGNCAVTDTSLFTCSWNSGYFTSTPTCIGAIINNSTTASTVAKADSASTSSGLFRTYYSDTANSATKAAFAFSISCTKTGSDYLQNTITANNYDFDWTTCPSISGSWSTNTTYTCKYMRKGGDAHFQVKVATSGAPTSSALDINMPTGIVIDTSRLADTSSGYLFRSIASAIDFGVNTYSGSVRYTSSSAVRVFTQTVTGSNVVVTDVSQAAPFTFGSGDSVDVNFTVPVVGWSNTQNAPQLLGSVTSNASNAERIERVRFGGSSTFGVACTSSPCTIQSQSGSWVTSVTRGSTGVYTINFAAGTWSSAPSCQCIGYDDGRVCNYQTYTSTTILLRSAVSTTNAVSDQPLDIICMGPR